MGRGPRFPPFSGRGFRVKCVVVFLTLRLLRFKVRGLSVLGLQGFMVKRFRIER